MLEEDYALRSSQCSFPPAGSRPSWILVRSGETPIWPELNPAPEERLNIGNVTPDLFGRIVK